MKNPKVTKIQDSVEQFEALCTSLDGIGQSLMSNTSYENATNGIALANESLSGLRAELDRPKHLWEEGDNKLVSNDFFAVSQISKRAGREKIMCEINEQGRIIELKIWGNPHAIDEVTLLSELESLSIDGFEGTDPAPLLTCHKLTTLNITKVKFDVQRLESVLESMPWLLNVSVSGAEAMRLGWAESHQKLTRLAVTKSAIIDLDPLSNCVKLESLNIAFNPVRSVKALEGLADLERLDIRGTNLADFWEIGALSSIRKLKISESMKKLPGFAVCKAAIDQRGGWVIVGG